MQYSFEIKACHGPTKQLRFPLQLEWRSPPPLTRLDHYKSIFFRFKGFMSGAETWAGSMSPLTQLVCTPVTPPIA
jgi:hypothetical protein